MFVFTLFILILFAFINLFHIFILILRNFVTGTAFFVNVLTVAE